MTATSRSVRMPGLEEQPGRQAAPLQVGPQPAAQSVLQLKAGPKIGARHLLSPAAHLERKLKIEEQARSEVAPGGQSEPAGRLLADLEHVEAEPLPRAVGDGARERAHRHLL